MRIQVNLSIHKRTGKFLVIGNRMPPVQLVGEQLGMIIGCGRSPLLHVHPNLLRCLIGTLAFQCPLGLVCVPCNIIAHEFAKHLRSGPIIGSAYLQELFVKRALDPNAKA